ncbi:peptidoglycan binding protein CsiV [Psychrobium sp. MM17-31]|uniref:CsiV family protein n=1 Tax=Psychrobium sp. MM17-31 TaxID=2917758 RepID=UPI001EF64F16|nr:CsiV family protein [Psychrobium sp. MM17-31]MCG7531667.1 peptidoglycan binding protein CsiV [Psychrobium sp. MM17-31]
MKHPISALSLLVSSLMFTSTSHASESWFEVEVIVFERLGQQTKQQFKEPVKHFNTEKTIRLVDDAFYGTAAPCPNLSQFERFSLLPKETITDENLESFAEPAVENTTVISPEAAEMSVENVAAEPEIEIIECVAPDDTLLQQAFVEKAKREEARALLIDSGVADSAQTVDNTSNISLAQQLTGEQPTPIDAESQSATSENTAAEDSSDEHTTESLQAQGLNDTEALAPVYNPDIYIPYPTEFEFNGVHYRAIEQQERRYKTPLTVFQTVELDNVETAEPQVNADEDQPPLLHNPESPYLLDQSRLEMSELVKKLRWQKDTKPLLHLGWRQPTLARHLAKPIHLFAGEDYSQEFDVNGQDKARLAQEAALAKEKLELEGQLQEESVVDKYSTSDTLVEPNTLPQPLPSTNIEDILGELKAQQPVEDQPLWRLDGLLKIYLNHYLFIETDFDLRKVEQVKQLINDDVTDELLEQELVLNDAFSNQENNAADVENPDTTSQTRFVSQLTSHPMKQHRRVRSKEIHYFDHSTLGMIIQIRRFKIPEPPTAPAS